MWVLMQARTASIVRNLIELQAEATYGDRTSLEELVSVLVLHVLTRSGGAELETKVG